MIVCPFHPSNTGVKLTSVRRRCCCPRTSPQLQTPLPSSRANLLAIPFWVYISQFLIYHPLINVLIFPDSSNKLHYHILEFKFHFYVMRPCDDARGEDLPGHLLAPEREGGRREEGGGRMETAATSSSAAAQQQRHPSQGFQWHLAITMMQAAAAAAMRQL